MGLSHVDSDSRKVIVESEKRKTEVENIDF